jgi:hypothetical protein
LLPLVVGGAGFWLGLTGAAPMLVWWWLRRPRPAVSGAEWVVDAGATRGYRFGRFRTLLELDAGAGGRLEIFHDELAPADLARLRRLVRAASDARLPN